MKRANIITAAVVLSSAIMSLFFLLLNAEITVPTDGGLSLQVANESLRVQMMYSVSVVIFLGAVTHAVQNIWRKNLDTQMQACNAKLTEEVDFHQNAIRTHTTVTISDDAAIITEVNENFEQVFGYKSDEIVGQSQAVLYPHQHLDPVFLEIGEVTRDHKIWTGEQKLRAKNGKTIYTHTTVVPKFDENGNHIQNISLRTDVTAARKAEVDRFLNVVLEELQDEVYIYSVDDLAMKYANRAARQRCEWDLSEVATHHIDDTTDTFDVSFFRHHVKPLKSGEREIVSIELMHPKGPVEIMTRLIHGLDDSPLFLSVLRDISYRREIENAKMESVSVVSHELRSPLTSIKGSLRLLQSGVVGELDPKAMSILDIATRNSERLLLVVNDILDLEKIEANKMDFTMSEIDLVAFLKDAVEMNKGYGYEHSVTIETELPFARAMANGNADRLGQVMTNLMSNAIKFSPLGGIVRVKLAMVGDNWRVSVIDTGPGIPEAARAEMFLPFNQQAPVDGRKRQGSGLGLAIVKSIIRRHSGRVSYISEVGAGSEFYFDIPSAEPVETAGFEAALDHVG